MKSKAVSVIIEKLKIGLPKKGWKAALQYLFEKPDEKKTGDIDAEETWYGYDEIEVNDVIDCYFTKFALIFILKTFGNGEVAGVSLDDHTTKSDMGYTVSIDEAKDILGYDEWTIGFSKSYDHKPTEKEIAKDIVFHNCGFTLGHRPNNAPNYYCQLLW